MKLYFTLRLFRGRNKDLVGDFANMDVGRDIIVKKCFGELARLHEFHTTFIPLQHSLMFPYGENGYLCRSKSRVRVRISLREFITFRIQQRSIESGNIVNAC